MFRRFFIWRAQKKLARTRRYPLDKRHYKGRFNSGFISDLQRARFWESESDPYYRRQKQRKRLKWVFIFCLILFLGWVIWESIIALSILG